MIALRRFFVALVVTGLFCPVTAVAAVWGENYFPNVTLVTDEGEPVRFFDDLIKDKVVLVNFIYTTCVDTCPLETAQLVQVQKILGDRLGKDVFFYSITIDPDHDTAEVLREYKNRFRAGWTFLTGDEEDIVLLRKKLGLYIEEIQDGSNNHNVNMIIGNQSTGRWMKRSPFENPYVLADQLGNWLTGWKAPQREANYADAPQLRNIPRGEQLFRTRCSICHTVTGVEADDAIGPDLMGVTEKRDMNWLLNWLRAPDQMLADNDPTAIALLAKYNNVAMPNMRLNKQEAVDLLNYIETESRRLQSAASSGSDTSSTGDLVGIMNAWIRETDELAKANAGYMTLINMSQNRKRLVNIRSDAFEKVEMHEMVVIDGMMRMRALQDVVIPASGQVSFAPGGKHLMMNGPRYHLTSGEFVDVTLIFDSGEEQTIGVKVAAK
jgi:copper(I)-binding protein/cytochrome oxidase Cu insertion factor (SCO1/SenC/PrrC family)